MSAPNKDPEHLDRLRNYYAENRRIPSFQRIAELLGFASKAASSKLMQRFADAGFVERTPDDDAWMPTRQFFAPPLAGVSVRAGAPDMIEGEAGSPFFVDDYLVRSPSSTVMITVQGDSMIDAGIHDGDVAVVERTASVQPGDYVVAVVDGEYTLKELARERGRFVLKPHNAAYPVLRPKGELEVFGVMVGLVRRF